MADTNEIRINTELTPDELHALDLTEELANVLNRVVGWSSSREQDLAELLVKINELRHAVLAQVAARTYPDRFRLLGRTFTPPPPK
ncbi:MAG: hypothetical protein ABJC62_10515 [Frankiaceae bacterium]|jgi:hypothetical protein